MKLSRGSNAARRCQPLRGSGTSVSVPPTCPSSHLRRRCPSEACSADCWKRQLQRRQGTGGVSIAHSCQPGVASEDTQPRGQATSILAGHPEASPALRGTRYGNRDRMLRRARSGQEGPAKALAKTGHKGRNNEVPKAVRRLDPAGPPASGRSGTERRPGASPRARAATRAASPRSPHASAAPRRQERAPAARRTPRPRAAAAGSAGGRGRARSGPGRELGPQRVAADKEPGTAPSLKTKASAPGLL